MSFRGRKEFAMNPYRQSIVEKTHSGLTLEIYLRDVMQYSGRSLQRLTHKKAIRLNGKTVFLQKKVKTGDQIRVYEQTDQTFGVQPEQGQVDIVYEDENMIVLNKPPFQLVHPAGQTSTGTLANVLAYYFESICQVHTIRPIHRLDRDTSGCVVFAKHAHTQHQLEQQLQTGTLQRQYIAIVEGEITERSGTIEAAIGKHPSLANRRAIVEAGKVEHAVTHFEVLTTCSQASCIKLTLETGRTHQIRLHMAHIGHPVIGDRMYGRRSSLIARQALHAYRVAFYRTDDPSSMVEAIAPIPNDMRELWKKLSGEDMQDP
jgi:23S rRNA pseudouridine1911/1915/1917 synthase